MIPFTLSPPAFQEPAVPSHTPKSTAAPFGDALMSGDRSLDLRPEEDIYRGLLGSWDVRVVDHLAEGTLLRSEGEWHFTRVLEGRAVQDVWISPPRRRGRTREAHPRSRYGTSVRMMDPATRQWHVTWLNPVSGIHDELVARMEGQKLIQEGRRPNGQAIRWTFTEITPTTFHWIGEGQAPDGTWSTEAEFIGQRKR